MAVRDISTEPCPAREGTNHCPHLSQFQHAMPHHRDDYCCWCGKAFCINTYDAEAAEAFRAQHGPNL